MGRAALTFLLLSLSPALRAETADLGARPPEKRHPERPPFCSKLDLPLPLTGGLRFFTFRLGTGPAAGASWREAARSGEGLTRLERVLGTALPAALFSMAAVGAFMPGWLPDGMADRMNFRGHGRPPPLTGIGPDIHR